jgi:hypothetical protein
LGAAPAGSTPLDMSNDTIKNGFGICETFSFGGVTREAQIN